MSIHDQVAALAMMLVSGVKSDLATDRGTKIFWRVLWVVWLVIWISDLAGAGSR